jgi:hypothetical protein
VRLVEQLEATAPSGPALNLADLAGTEPIGLAGRPQGPEVEVGERRLDPMRIFTLEAAAEIKEALDAVRIRSAIAPLAEIQFPDDRPRFEVRVKKEDYESAEARLAEVRREQMSSEGFDGDEPADVEHCPACGAHVPLTADECPDCGLVIGAG